MIVRMTTTAICGSDLHLIHGMIPNLQEDYVIGHEPMGIVEEVGSGVTEQIQFDLKNIETALNAPTL
ncbi:threonine dehydrogenase-like Zn-dependent dehydrogenase [Paenibacillus sp. V4I3]|nr:threonine dehydrogenase-like Zn-dependent dehydrogenase [Paenibacillus sp. V4I3]MDQ0888303.1 threonine dehydrogenase-like Zn-dependent dehydrogenase [Paenibacillus sp. V4I9]